MAGIKRRMMWPFSSRVWETDRTCESGFACTENNGVSDVYGTARQLPGRGNNLLTNKAQDK